MTILSSTPRGDIEVFNMANVNVFDVSEKPQWCPGCGDYSILGSFKAAITELNIDPHRLVVVTGIGCGSKIAHYVRAYGFEGLHGRILPLAEGIKAANPKLTVIGIGGDGDGFSEGGNHFVHAPRKNLNYTYMVQDNHIYALTTGQTSPTTPKNLPNKTSPTEQLYEEYKPVAAALVNGVTFVASCFAGNMKHTTEMMKKAIQHKGFSFLLIYQPCVTWNNVNTYQWYMQKCYDLQKEGHDASNFDAAMAKALEPYRNGFERLPTGVFYESKARKPLDELHPVLAKGIVPAEKDISNVDVSKLLKEME
jgi:2-oxoglutarate ferredoxin oxidoreductase subunit beta